MLKQLKRIYNLVFLEFKPLFTYFKVLPEILTSIVGILMFPTIERSVRAKFRHLRDYFKLRSDLEEV
jgi:hypothetical protein